MAYSSWPYSTRIVAAYVRGALTIVVIITHDNLLHLPVLAHLAPDILVKGIEMRLQLLRVHLRLWVRGRRRVPQVRQQDRLRVRGLDVFPRAAVAVAARADLVVEGAVDLVLLCAEDGGEVGGWEGKVSRRFGNGEETG